MNRRPGWTVDEHGPDGVEEDLEGAEEGLAEEGVEEEGFDGGGEVGVEAGYTEGLVMCEMVWLNERKMVSLFLSLVLSFFIFPPSGTEVLDMYAYPESSTVRQPNR